MALLDDISAALVAGGLGQTSSAVDWMIFLGRLDDTPDRAICIYETGGDAPEEKWAIDRPSFQVRVRGAADDYQAARAKLQAVFDLLHAGEVNIGGSYVFCYAIHSGAIPLGADEKRRPHLAQNYRVMKAA